MRIPPPIPPLRPSEQFALKILGEESGGGATDRRWLIGLMLSRSTRWKLSTFAHALIRLARSGYVKRWRAGKLDVQAPALMPEAGISEKQFQQAVIDLAKRNGWEVYHTRNSRKSEKGFPDLVLVREAVLYRELKVGDNQPTADQSKWLDALRWAGGDAEVWYPDDWPEIEQLLGTPCESRK